MPTPQCHIQPKPFGDQTAYRLTDSVSGSSVTVLPFLGGAINSFEVFSKRGKVELLDGYSDLEEINRELHSSFKGCNLFPFPNRVAHGQYTHNGCDHYLQLNFQKEKHAIHGLLYDKPMHYLDHREGEEHCSLDLRFKSSGLLPGYPFRCQQITRYTLHRTHGFTCTTWIKNCDTTSMPVGQGWHPYYTGGAKTITHLRLRLPQCRQVELSPEKLPSGKEHPFQEFHESDQLSNIELDNCLRNTSIAGRAEIFLDNPSINLRLIIWQKMGSRGYNYVQLFTPPHRTSFAIEPMTCEPNAFNTRKGLITLFPGKTFSTKWGISIREISP